MVGTPFRQGDSRYDLLRKMLEALSAGASPGGGGGVVEGGDAGELTVDLSDVDVGVNDDSPVVIIDFSFENPALVGQWLVVSHRFDETVVCGAPGLGPWNSTMNDQVIQITASPINFSYTIDDFIVDGISRYLRIGATIRPTQTEAENDTGRRILYCALWPDDAPSFLGNQWPWDDFDKYSDGQQLDGLSKGTKWIGVWEDMDVVIGLKSSENYDSYSDGVNLLGLNAGTGWSVAWVDDTLTLGVEDEDTFDTYSDGVSLVGLAGGAVWGAAWADQENDAGLQAGDNYDSYSDAVNLAGLNNGGGWSAAWADKNNTV